YGIYVMEARGTRKWDVDGNEYLDFFGGHGANMLGHSPPVLVEAVREAIGRGVQYAANHPLEVALAQEVVRLLPTAEKVRFTASGTEATLLAIRLARAFTGRRKIVRFASHYHGWHDHAASGYAGEFDGSAAPGVLPEVAIETVLLRTGDERRLAAAVDRYGDDIAGFIVEPVGTHFGVVPVSPDFLHLVGAAARSCGGLFILDEVLSGFRVAMGGVQEKLGLRPDLTTLAKILCGGLPGGAVAGRADVLDLLDHDVQRRGGRPKVLHQGTFTGNPVSMAAGLAVLKEIEVTDGCETANALGRYARHRLNEMSMEEALPFTWYGEYSIFHLFVREDGGSGTDGFDPYSPPMEAFLSRPQPMINRLRMALNVLGIDLNTRCSGIVSAVHTVEEVDRLVDKVREAALWVRSEGHIRPRV
ncbi:MAG TPA: aminotransferase class III-fold pyridoxal phosphate-dependent enzyme, partial [Allosphingosinicella sp.]|nr:aminotransferase class III-fold pyridoxal phosphate-dependent enzyme [Allosphingosinicella sp.]